MSNGSEYWRHWLDQSDTPLLLIVRELAPAEWDGYLGHLASRPDTWTPWRAGERAAAFPARHADIDVATDHLIAVSTTAAATGAWYYEDELVLEPRLPVTDESGVAGLREFMRELGVLLGRDVVLCPEWEVDFEICAYRTATDTVGGFAAAAE